MCSTGCICYNIFLFWTRTDTYLSLRLMHGWVEPPNMGISVPISIWMSSNVHTTLRANLWLDAGSGRFSSGLGSGNGGQVLNKFKNERILKYCFLHQIVKYKDNEPQSTSIFTNITLHTVHHLQFFKCNILETGSFSIIIYKSGIWDLKFSWQWLWRMSSWMWCPVRPVRTYVLEECVASIFKVERYGQMADIFFI
jgi:hypothetical protein